MQPIQGGIFTLNIHDVLKGAIVSVIAAVLMVIYGVTSTAGFDAFSTDWTAVGHSVVNASTVSFVAYLVKNLFTGANGKFIGLI